MGCGPLGHPAVEVHDPRGPPRLEAHRAHGQEQGDRDRQQQAGGLPGIGPAAQERDERGPGRAARGGACSRSVCTGPCDAVFGSAWTEMAMATATRAGSRSATISTSQTSTGVLPVRGRRGVPPRGCGQSGGGRGTTNDTDETRSAGMTTTKTTIAVVAHRRRPWAAGSASSGACSRRRASATSSGTRSEEQRRAEGGRAGTRGGASSCSRGAATGWCSGASTCSRGRTTPLAIVPAGTANLFATNLGIPQDIEAAVEIGLRGDRRKLDLESSTASASPSWPARASTRA